MRIAIIGQSAFASEVLKLLQKNGHEIVGVFTVPDKDGREDTLGERDTPPFLLWGELLALHFGKDRLGVHLKHARVGIPSRLAAFIWRENVSYWRTQTYHPS